MTQRLETSRLEYLYQGIQKDISTLMAASSDDLSFERKFAMMTAIRGLTSHYLHKLLELEGQPREPGE